MGRWTGSEVRVSFWNLVSGGNQQSCVSVYPECFTSFKYQISHISVGEAGSVGYPGGDGSNGARGADGKPGYSGAPGAKGIMGDTGYTYGGAPGPLGDSGDDYMTHFRDSINN